MSLRGSKKISAFAVFKSSKNKQGTSDEQKDTGGKDANERPPLNKKTQKAVTKRIKASLRKKTKERPSCLPDDATTPITNLNTLSPRIKKRPSRSQVQTSDTASTGKVSVKEKKKVKEQENKDTVNEERPAKKRKLNDNKDVSCNKDVITPDMFVNDDVKFEDSAVAAEKLFEWMINPVKPKVFFSKLWENKPLLVKRHLPSYNNGWFSTEELDRILRENELDFTTNIDVTTYTNGQRETHNPAGRAHASVVWDFYQNGCSVRLLNPQTYSKPMWKLNSMLQEYFSSCVGANVYLTPPGSQGFAPHYDDIEAFVLQLEGKKHWRLYNPRSEEETLPRYSSANFKEEDIGEPILDVILEAGDLLYFPRGTIHQADTAGDSHSLHVTVSTCQLNSWGDLMMKLVPRALQVAFEEDLEFRRALPRDYLNYMGVANSDSSDPKRGAFLSKVAQLMMKLVSYAPVDAAADQMSVGFIHDSLPPVITEGEKSRCVLGNGARWTNGKVTNETQVEETTKIRIIRRGAVRLVTEDDKVLVYYTLENSRVYREKEPQFIEIFAEAAPAVEYLLKSYPSFVRVDDLPMEAMPDKQVDIAQALYERGLLVTEETMTPLT
ncbi:ribosomal oxygenase 1-like [Ptychodera flava]|uniref:ribosomal oxygenase 1-like n=1 Tax=Ptychodera flava TaxID=63121 RepID=UPI00396A03BA